MFSEKTILKFLLFLTLFCPFLLSSVQSVSGFVYDFDDRSPISNANVFITKYNIGTATDKNGYFLLPVSSIDENQIELNIKVIGYKQKILSIDMSNYCSNCSMIDLDMLFINKNPIELEGMHVHSHADYTSHLSNIDISGKELDQNLKGNIATTLSNYPNIGINSFGSVVSKPALRGFSGDRFLLTKEGDETGDLSQSSIDHVIALDMSEVIGVEVIRGPRSLVFGANAIGGVVNTDLIGSPDFRVEKFYHRYMIGSESFNRGVYANMILCIPDMGTNNQVNLFLSKKNTKNEISSIGELANTDSENKNQKISFINYNKDGYISYSLENFNMGYGIPPNIGGHISGVDILLSKKTQIFSFHKDISLYQFNQVDIKYNFIDYIHLELVNNSVKTNDLSQLYNAGDYHLALAKQTHNFQIELNSQNSILGLEYNKKEFTPSGYYLTPDTEELYYSIYGYNENNIESLDLDLFSSFRLGFLNVLPKADDVQYINLDSEDVKNKNFKATSVSFGAAKEFNHFKLDGWLMHTMRPPRVEELFSDGPHLGTYSYEIGNPNLDIEEIYGIESSINYNHNPFNFSITGFYNYSPYYFEMAKMGDCPESINWDPLSGTSHPCAGVDFIDWGSGEFGFLYKYNSRGVEAVLKGLELSFEYKIKDFQLSYNFSNVDGANETLGRPLSYMNPTKEILSIEYSRSLISYKVSLTKIHEQNRLGEFETYTPGAFLTDFVLSYRKHGSSITLQLNNIFDNKYYNHLSRIKDIVPEPGQNIHLIYKVSF